MPLPKITPLQNRQTLYTDFHKDLSVNPISNDLALKVNEQAINESLRNLILTDRGERLFQPNLGSDVRATLFENNTPATIRVLKERVKDVINNYEPRITLIDVEISTNYDDEKVKITIVYYIINSENPITFTVFLERIR
jgi:uncharacterized protein